MQRLILGVIVVLVVSGVATLLAFVPQQSKARITPASTIVVGDQLVSVAIADTPEKRQQGLSGVQDLAGNEGMLFIFEDDGQHSFWMKDMLFSIDMVWLTSDGRVVHIAPSVSPDTYPQTFTSPVPARYVLEVSAGFAEKHGIKVGSSLGWSGN